MSQPSAAAAASYGLPAHVLKLSMDDLSMSQIVDEAGAELDRETLSRTLALRNVPVAVPDHALMDIVGSTPGGVMALMTIPKSSMGKTVLIEFRSPDAVHDANMLRRLYSLGEAVVVEMSRVTVQQAQVASATSSARRAATVAHDQRVGLETRIRELQAEVTMLRGELHRRDEVNAHLRSLLEELGVTSDIISAAAGSAAPSGASPYPHFTPSPQLPVTSAAAAAAAAAGGGGGGGAAAAAAAGGADADPVLTSLRAEEFAERADRVRRATQARAQARAIARSADVFYLWRRWAHRRAEDRRNEELLQSFLRDERSAAQAALERKEYPCSICFTEITVAELYILDGCYHRFCAPCLKQYCETKIADGDVRTLICPDTSCKMEISASEVKQLVDPRLYERYSRFTLEKALAEMPDVRWCLRPGCSNAVIGGPNTTMILCTACNYTFCARCKCEWHADSTCEKYQLWIKENAAGDSLYSTWVANNAKSCGKCRAPIEKNGGCNHMTCASCKYEFCWLCGGKYSKDHFGKGKCQQFS